MASQQALMVRQLLKDSFASQAGTTPTIEEMRQGLEALMGSMPIAPDVKVEKITIEQIPAEWVNAPNAVEDRVILYLHGGGYFLGSCITHRDLAAKLSRASASRVLVIEYRLAPENPFPAAIEDAVAAYRWLISSGVAPEKIVIGGDSAGGGLTMATLLSLREAGDPLPAASILLSPWTDMEGTGDSMVTRAEFDPWLNPEQSHNASLLYIGDLDRRHPLVSPIYADLQGLPPMLVHVGHDEILLDDSMRLVERAREAGIDATLKIWEDMWHVFHSFAIPEAAEAIGEIGVYVAAKLES